MVDVQAQKRTRKPKARPNKTKRLGRLPLAAVTPVRETGPVPYTPTRELVDIVDQDPEGGEPGGADEQVEGVMKELGREGEEPDEGEEDGDGSDDFDVDLAPLRTDAVFVVLVQEVGVYAEDDRRTHKLAEAKEEGSKA